MGFFDFFKKIGNTIKSGFTTIYNKVIKPVGQFVHKKILTPIYNKAIKPVGEKIIALGSKLVGGVEHVIDSGVKVADAVGTGGAKLIDGVGNAAQGLGSLLSNPMMWMMGAGVGIVVISKLKQ